MGSTRDPAASVWLKDQMGTHSVPGKRVSMGRAAALPDALDIGRALRPLRRPWLSGVQRRLDVNATVDHYTRTGMLVPQLAPAPEPWLEVIVVLDRGTAMAVWDETVRVLTKMLRALAAFRDVRVWHLEHPPGETPVLHDHHGRALPMHPDAAQHTQPARRLLLVVSDCAAPAWRQEALWRTLHTWGRAPPRSPSSTRCLSGFGSALALIFLAPPRPRPCPPHPAVSSPTAAHAFSVKARRTKPWQALPVLQWHRPGTRVGPHPDAHDPNGCEAVLVRPPADHLCVTVAMGRSTRTKHPPTSGFVPRAEAFTDDRQSNAVRLAIAASPLGFLHAACARWPPQRLVPEPPGRHRRVPHCWPPHRHPPRACRHALPLPPAAASHLTSLLTRDQLWDTHFALSDHLAAHLQAPHGIPVVLHSPHAEEILATGVRPIAHAAAATHGCWEWRQRIPCLKPDTAPLST
ncbi:Tetratricopeptide repeat protein OS=Streptomyces griseomycini OX=66895 GN=FHS37_007765 PE=4 SV=1 [Streptomyces griseomycini]